jgi:hypothetical protein
MIASSFLYYALHYIILRTLYDGARAIGISPVLFVVCAAGALLAMWVVRGRRRADVFERKNLWIFVNDFRRNLLRGNFAKQAVSAH